MDGFKKGMEVRLRRGMDPHRSYIIRSIGKKQAILDRKLTPEERNWGSMGHSWYLTPPDRVARWQASNPGQPLPDHYYTKWSDLFIPINNEWDFEDNC